ncbi:MAG: alpha/beta hydrolase [Gemmatimonadota bacterium]
MVTLASGLRLRVAESGAVDCAPILLLHGWGASLYMWRDWFALLAAAGRRAIAVDIPGHGLSDKPDDVDAYRLSSLTRTVCEFLAQEHLTGIDVVAHSMAGTIALEMMTQPSSPIGRAVLVNPACFGRVRLEQLFPLAGVSSIDRVLPRLVRKWIVARTHRLQYDDPSRIKPRDEDEYWAPSQFPAYTRAMRRLVHVFQWKRGRVDEIAAQLRRAGVPVLAILGDKDGLVREAIPFVSALQGACTALEMKVIARGGHAMNEERPEEISALALDFFRRSPLLGKGD